MKQVMFVRLFAVECQSSKVADCGSGRVAHHVYAPFGYAVPTSSVAVEMAYKGEMLDYMSGSYVLGGRRYFPSIKRFNCPDAWSPFGKGGINAYAGFGNDPVNNVDPDGHSFYKWLKQRLPFDSNTKRQYRVVRKFNLKNWDRLVNAYPYDTLASYVAKNDLSDINIMRVSSRKHLVGLVGEQHKYVYTAKGELIVGDASKKYFFHPVLDGFSRSPGNVVAAGYIRFKEGRVLVSNHTGHYYESARGEDKTPPVLFYIQQFGLPAEPVKDVRG